MRIPKFTAEASLENYAHYEHLSTGKYEYHDSSVKIEPALKIENLEICDVRNCRTERCRYRCGTGIPVPVCEGTRQVCDFECCKETEEYGRICYSRIDVTPCM